MKRKFYPFGEIKRITRKVSDVELVLQQIEEGQLKMDQWRENSDGTVTVRCVGDFTVHYVPSETCPLVSEFDKNFYW